MKQAIPARTDYLYQQAAACRRLAGSNPIRLPELLRLAAEYEELARQLDEPTQKSTALH
jgi:hypothetical protein